MLPVLGGPAAVLVNRAFGSAVQRRNERIFDEIAADLERLFHLIEGIDPEAILASDEFQAAMHRTFRAAQETASDSKRKLLRNALLNGYATPTPTDERDKLLSIMARYEPEHVLVLNAMAQIMAGRTELLEHATTHLQRHFEDRPLNGSLYAYLQDLVSDRLVTESAESRMEEINIGYQFGRPQKRQIAKPYVWHGMSAQGEEFLRMVADPFDLRQEP